MRLTPVYKEKAASAKPKSSGQGVYYGCGMAECPHCDSGQPDSKCICGEHSFAIAGEKIACPVCGQGLRELTVSEADKLKGVVSRVKVKGEQARLAGVETEPVKKLQLFKEIRTVGKVAFDPELAVAEEEFISALKSYDKSKESKLAEVKERAENLLNSARRRLLLLGLNEQQIEELVEKRKVQSGLVLPEDKMWVYGDVYEFEMDWLKQGQEVEVTTASFPGREFRGTVNSIHPVLDPKTRSVRFRAEVENPGLKLKPEMYVDILVKSNYAGPEGQQLVLAVPINAVLDTGRRKVVWVDKGNGEYEGRQVVIGSEAQAQVDDKVVSFYPVLRGLREGDQVVVRANFLIDSQSQISGTAATAYGGALGAEEQSAPVHQH